MSTDPTIICPKCKTAIPVEEAFGHAYRERIETETAKMYQEELNKKEEKLREAQKNELIIRKQKIELEEEKRSFEIEKQRQIDEEREKIRLDERIKAEEEHRLKDLGFEKKLQDTLKLNQELRQKLEQGSQQTQGEVLELELETLLRSEFPVDRIKEVAKGVRGADIIQTVVDVYGRECGTILWESKNAKWSGEWLSKLKEDQQVAKAQVAVLVSINLPDGVKNFTFNKEKKIWITNYASVVGLAWAIRINIAQLHATKLSSVGKNEKMEVLYGYLTGPEFSSRVEAIVGAFNNLKTDLDKEKKWFAAKWARQEKEIERIIGNTQGMYGDLQGVTDRSLPEIKTLELETGD